MTDPTTAPLEAVTPADELAALTACLARAELDPVLAMATRLLARWATRCAMAEDVAGLDAIRAMQAEVTALRGGGP